jgi:hypothetical protein
MDWFIRMQPGKGEGVCDPGLENEFPVYSLRVSANIRLRLNDGEVGAVRWKSSSAFAPAK